MIKGSIRVRSLVGLAAVAVIATACSSSGASSSPSTAASTAPTTAASTAASAGASASAAAKTYKIGYSNGGGVGNGFREEQVCTAKAQAKASGAVSDLTVIHRNTDAAGQLADIRTLIAKGVNAIVFNPNDPKALNPALAEAAAAGIKTVAVDSYVTDPNTWNLYNNQVKYAELGAKWLFDQLGGTGTVWYTRGIAGNSADSDRDVGFKNVLKNYPNIKVVPSPRMASPPAGIRPPPRSSRAISSRAAGTTRSTGSGRRAWASRSSTRSRRTTRRSSRSRTPTSAGS